MTTTNEKGRDSGKSATPTTRRNDSSAKAQRTRLLAALHRGAITTIQARRDLDIMMPAARVHELRHREGFDIATVWCEEPTDCGKLHRVARYVLRATA